MAAEAAKHCIKKAIVRNTSHEGVSPSMGYCFRGFLFARQSAFLRPGKEVSESGQNVWHHKDGEGSRLRQEL